MTSPAFNNYFPWLIEHEGGYENDPDDPGGETKYGIDKRSHPEVNIRNLTLAGAKQIYWDEYWTPVRAPELPEKVAWALCDCAVNCGRTRAVKWLQTECGVTPDGVFGPKTMAAVLRAINSVHAGDKVLASLLIAAREAHYLRIAKGRMAKFKRGWLNRNNDLRKALGL